MKKGHPAAFNWSGIKRSCLLAGPNFRSKRRYPKVPFSGLEEGRAEKREKRPKNLTREKEDLLGNEQKNPLSDYMSPSIRGTRNRLADWPSQWPLLATLRRRPPLRSLAFVSKGPTLAQRQRGKKVRLPLWDQWTDLTTRPKKILPLLLSIEGEISSLLCIKTYIYNSL